jgi:hypothetical protein
LQPKPRTTRLQQITKTYQCLDCIIEAVAMIVFTAIVFTNPQSGWVVKILLLIGLAAGFYSMYKQMTSR